MRYLLPLLFLLGACQTQDQPATDGSAQTVAILTSNVIDDGTCAMQADCEVGAAECSMEGDADCSMKGDADCAKMDAADCSMAGAVECSMEGDADCDKMDAADCSMAGAAECSMEGDADCAKEDCAEGSACCEQSECEEE